MVVNKVSKILLLRQWLWLLYHILFLRNVPLYYIPEPPAVQLVLLLEYPPSPRYLCWFRIFTTKFWTITTSCISNIWPCNVICVNSTRRLTITPPATNEPEPSPALLVHNPHMLVDHHHILDPLYHYWSLYLVRWCHLHRNHHLASTCTIIWPIPPPPPVEVSNLHHQCQITLNTIMTITITLRSTTTTSTNTDSICSSSISYSTSIDLYQKLHLRLMFLIQAPPPPPWWPWWALSTTDNRYSTLFNVIPVGTIKLPFM